MKARPGEFWELTLGVDLKSPKLKVRYVQAWAGVESVFEDEGHKEVIWLPRCRLGKAHAVKTTEAAATKLAEKDGAASGLPRWTEPKP